MKIYIIEELLNETGEIESTSNFLTVAGQNDALQFFLDNYIINDNALTLHALYIGYFQNNVYYPAFIRVEEGKVISRLLRFI